MKVTRTEAHDRFLEIQKQEDPIQQGFEDCKFRNPLSLELFEYSNYIYVFAHKREVGADEKLEKFMRDLTESMTNPFYQRKYTTMSDVPSFRILWQPRLTKPEPQPNSYLFRTLKDNNDVEVYWILPPFELFNEYQKGDMIQDEIICESIDRFLNNKASLCVPHRDDLPLEKVKEIIRKMCKKDKKKEKKLIL
jgi:hypothetical protein